MTASIATSDFTSGLQTAGTILGAGLAVIEGGGANLQADLTLAEDVLPIFASVIPGAADLTLAINALEFALPLLQSLQISGGAGANLGVPSLGKIGGAGR